MAGKRITSLNTLTGANTATIDVLPIVDVSAGEAKQITTQELSNALVTINGGLQGGFGVYTNTTLGLANTANGGYFFVPSANTGESLSMYQDIGGTAVYITGIPEFNPNENPFGGDFRIFDNAFITSMFVYDTTKDSDGGEWRRKCQNKSWYNESLNTSVRGSRREFPEKALIITSISQLYIYDLDSGSPVLWMTTSGSVVPYIITGGTTGPLACTAALNGVLYIGTRNNGAVGALTIFDFIRDEAVVRIDNTSAYWPRTIARRNENADNTPILSNYYSDGIVNRSVNSVAMTVLPDTPIDPVTGLPNPTVAVGTDGGVSIIHYDGKVVDITWASHGLVQKVDFRTTDKALCIITDGSTAYGRLNHVYRNIPREDIPNTFFLAYNKGYSDEFYPLDYSSTYTGTDLAFTTTGLGKGVGFNGLYHASSLQLTSMIPNPEKPENGARAVITNTYNTGYMVGDIKLALAESTSNTTSLVETELITNGTFDTDTAWTKGTGWVIGSGVATHTQATGSGEIYQEVSGLIVGRAYVLKATVNSTSDSTITNSSLGIVPTGGGSYIRSVTIAAGVTRQYVINFIATSTSVRVKAFSDDDISIDNYSLMLAVEDRSVANNYAVVKGNVSRTAVTTGAELAWYGGFATSGSGTFIESPDSLDLSGDFYFATWCQTSTTTNKFLFGHQESIGSLYGANTNFAFTTTGSGIISVIANSASILGDVVALPTNVPVFIEIGRTGSTLFLRKNGKPVSNVFTTADFSNSNAKLRIGVGYYNANLASAWSGNIGQFRFGLTPPTPEQSVEIYEKERKLFKANTSALLPSANCTSMSYDSYTDLLHVTTPSGSARIQGIEVVGKDSVVYNGVFAAANIVASFSSTGANTSIPSMYPFRDEEKSTEIKKFYDIETSLDNLENKLNGVTGWQTIVYASDVVDVFVYDTTKDSDGGKWRHKCQNKSWYNERLETTTRGKRRSFPEKVLIVVRSSTTAGSITIYDIDSGKPEMWMVFTGSATNIIYYSTGGTADLNTIFALNGNIYVGNELYDVWTIDFIKDIGTQILTTGVQTYKGNISQRNSSLGYSGLSGTGIVNRAVNSVRATVLPGTPIDPARGLPTPTLFVTTDGGTSIVHWNGDVYDLTYSSSPTINYHDILTFGKHGIIYRYVTSTKRIDFIPWDKLYADLSTTVHGEEMVYTNVFSTTGTVRNPFGIGGVITSVDAAKNYNKVFVGHYTGLSIIDYAPRRDHRNLVCAVTDTYNTGYMVGNTQLAFAESTSNTSNLIGGTVIDHSVANNHANVYGTLSRTAVATGAEVVAYSGFSANNYLEVPYSSTLDFGTGNFSFMAWVNVSINASRTIFEIADSSYSGTTILLRNVSNGFEFYAYTGLTNPAIVSTTPPVNTWNFVVAKKDSDVISVWVNGKLASTTITLSANLSNANAVTRIGQRVGTSNPFEFGSIALPRLSSTAPTPEQILQIYEEEKSLFQTDAKALLPNVNVNDLSYDEDMDILHVATANGYATMKGVQVLTKDNNTVYTKIHAVGNVVVAETSTKTSVLTSTDYKRPEKEYNRNKIKTKGHTISATPLVVYHIPFNEGEEGTFVTRTIAVNKADGAQIGSYEHIYTARRVNGSANVALIGSSNTVIQEVTSSLDCVVSNTSNYITLTYTGLSSNTIEWTSYTEGTFND